MDKKMIDADVYYTINKPCKGSIYKDKGSKFIGYAYPITLENEVKPLLDSLKKEHHAARHLCYAWQLGIEKIIYRANDDGEPSNSAGKPIYGQIKSKNLTNILLIVVRYYGGINLGVGGLIQAYKTTAQNCLSKVDIVQKVLKVNFNLTTDYAHLNLVMRFIKEHNLKIIRQVLEINCKFKVGVRKTEVKKIEKLLKSMHGIDFKIFNP